jgi:serine/threonine protein phosphatase 1
LKSLENYHLDEQRRYVHAGFTNVNGVDYEYFPGLFYWDRTLWETALALDKTMATDNISTPNVLLYIKKFTWVTHLPEWENTPVQKRMFGM